MITFALIADAHVGPEKPYEGKIRKLSRHSLTYLTELTHEIAATIKPDFVVQLGDLIEDDDDAELDEGNFLRGMERFERLAMPVLHIIGNHDQVNLSVPRLCRLIGKDSLHYSVDVAGLHCIVLFTACVEHTDIRIGEEQRAWLAADLAGTQLPTLIFLHHPLDDQSLKGNVWFEKYPSYCFVEDRQSLRQLLSESRKVIAVINGHVHQNSCSTIDGIHYITIQSMVERVGEPDVPSRAFAIATIGGGKLTVTVNGNDPAAFRLPIEDFARCGQAEPAL